METRAPYRTALGQDGGTQATERRGSGKARSKSRVRLPDVPVAVAARAWKQAAKIYRWRYRDLRQQWLGAWRGSRDAKRRSQQFEAAGFFEYQKRLTAEAECDRARRLAAAMLSSDLGPGKRLLALLDALAKLRDMERQFGPRGEYIQPVLTAFEAFEAERYDLPGELTVATSRAHWEWMECRLERYERALRWTMRIIYEEREHPSFGGVEQRIFRIASVALRRTFSIF